MNGETLKTLSLCSFFVFLFGVIGFLVAIILNALTLYNEASSSDMYETLVQTEIFSITNIPIYLLISVLFAGLGILIVYGWKHPNST
jgi:protein-S-isoprenylcysteine O-methyltransferase Ste14